MAIGHALPQSQLSRPTKPWAGVRGVVMSPQGQQEEQQRNQGCQMRGGRREELPGIGQEKVSRRRECPCEGQMSL